MLELDTLLITVVDVARGLVHCRVDKTAAFPSPVGRETHLLVEYVNIIRQTVNVHYTAEMFNRDAGRESIKFRFRVDDILRSRRATRN